MRPNRRVCKAKSNIFGKNVTLYLKGLLKNSEYDLALTMDSSSRNNILNEQSQTERVPVNRIVLACGSQRETNHHYTSMISHDISYDASNASTYFSRAPFTREKNAGHGKVSERNSQRMQKRNH